MFKRLQQRRQIEQSRERLYRLAWSWTHSNELADDLTQITLEKALTRLDQLRDHQRLDAWLSRILANSFRDHLRAQKQWVDSEECALETPELGPGQLQEQRQIVHQVRAAIASLKPPFRMVITMVDLMDMSYAEVAEAMDIPTGTVMSRVSRGRAYVKQFIEAQREQEGALSAAPASQVHLLSKARTRRAGRAK